ncbi:MAG: hypothetical protein ACE5F1_05590 [Planctomycetota bacterium]
MNDPHGSSSSLRRFGMRLAILITLLFVTPIILKSLGLLTAKGF